MERACFSTYPNPQHFPRVKYNFVSGQAILLKEYLVILSVLISDREWIILLTTSSLYG